MLNPGDRVAVVAPSHPFVSERLQAGCERLRSWGLEPVEMPHLRAQYRYTAGTRRQRGSDLVRALVDPSIDAVWYARGGSGTVHLLAELPLDRLDQRPVIGFSDATSLLSVLWTRSAGRPIHGPVLHTLGSMNDDQTVEATRALLFGEAVAQRWDCDVVRGGPRVQAPLVGGNLCVLASICGTPFQLDASGCVLLLEEVGEVPYKVDRLLSQLRLAGGLDGVQAVVLGDFAGADPPPGAEWSVEDVVAEALHGLEIPIVTGAPVGHGRTNLPFALGAACEVLPSGEVRVSPSMKD